MKKMKANRFLLIIILIGGIILLTSSLLFGVGSEQYETRIAPDFTTVDENGVEFSLNDYKGTVTILHFTGLELPLCIECEEEMKGQLVELENLDQSVDSVSIITVNIRKNPYSISGRDIAEQDYGINVGWHWVEDFSPYHISGLYQEYWTVNGAFSNPTLVLIDENQGIVGIYHVYCMGKGELDGVQTAESLAQDVRDIAEGRWEGFKGETSGSGVAFLSIFALGVLTSLSPCSIVLLVVMVSYVGSLRKDSEDTSKKLTAQGFWIGIFFTLGLSLVFFVFGMIIQSVGFFIEASAVFYLIAGVILIVLGINVFKPIKEILRIESRGGQSSQIMGKGQNIFFKLSKKSLYLGALFLGILFAIGWAPCAMSLMMPVFILTLTQKISIFMGGLLLFVFGLGHGVPIIPLCAVTSSVRGKLGNKYATAGRWTQKVFGVIIIIVGLIMAVRFWGINFW
jgi:cytochrome c-type biogenesis protein